MQFQSSILHYFRCWREITVEIGKYLINKPIYSIVYKGRYNNYLETMLHIPSSLKDYFQNFENDLSKPQFNHFQSWVVGILNGNAEATKINSEKHPSSLTRFMNSNSLDDCKLNVKRIR